MLALALGVSYLAVRSLRHPASATHRPVSPRSCCETPHTDTTRHQEGGEL